MANLTGRGNVIVWVSVILRKMSFVADVLTTLLSKHQSDRLEIIVNDYRVKCNSLFPRVYLSVGILISLKLIEMGPQKEREKV